MKFLNRLGHYDLFERHEAVKRFLGEYFQGLVLDVGGLSGLLKSYLTKA